MDPDHRLLLRSTKPLLQSRNASVVMATSQLYWHLAPKSEIQVVAKALVRLLRSHYEIQSIVLNSIASMTVQEFGGARIFGPYLRQFFVRGCDPSHVKILKLEILTILARPDDISILLREFQSYISGGEKSSVAATIQAIGRCAASIPEVTATCLTGLVQLLSSPDQVVFLSVLLLSVPYITASLYCICLSTWFILYPNYSFCFWLLQIFFIFLAGGCGRERAGD